ncbi:putative RNA polymerase II subunit B1 CTD phosphatase RPAP2 isoform X2 [Artemia franciscana]|uniref:putative RNA polymerase II subunit B1 CTD phosphatase RPAP2 isoform X2 n=1 Tax=Artemia franciscana TaxID=6661 RepID=UPI0032DA61F6
MTRHRQIINLGYLIPTMQLLKEAVIKKKECLKNVREIVEHLSEQSVDLSYLQDVAVWLDPQSYQDVVEERAIGNICGYPLCYNEIRETLKQSYKIDAYHNKVYDVKDRKNFCSNSCYIASCHLKDQLLTSPISSRDEEQKLELHFKPHNIPSKIFGEEIRFGHLISNEDQEVCQSDLDCDIDETIDLDEVMQSQKTHKELDEVINKTGGGNTVKQVRFAEELKTECHSSGKIDKQCGVAKSSIGYETGAIQGHIEAGQELMSLNLKDNNSEIERLGEKFKNECKTIETENICDAMNENVKEIYVKAVANLDENVNVDNTEIEKRNEETSLKKANHLDSFKCDVTITKEDHFPDLKEEASQKNAQIHGQKKRIARIKKVRNLKREEQASSPPELVSIHVERTLCEWFTLDTLKYLLGEKIVNDALAAKGKTITVESCGVDNGVMDRLLERLDRMDVQEGIADSHDEKEIEAVKKPLPSLEQLQKETRENNAKVYALLKGKMVIERPDNDQEPEEEEKESVYLPPVDSYSQKIQRRHIVATKLKLVIPDLLRTLDFGDCNIDAELRDLMSTFNFSSQNIVHEPYHWNLIGLALIYIICERDAILRLKLEEELPQKYMKMMLLGFNLDFMYLQRLACWLVDKILSSF